MRNKSKIIIIILIFFISIGFAYLSTNLYISGTSIVKRSVWDVHFNNIQNEICTYQIDSNATISSNSKQVDFTFTFEKPGDSYSFNIDVVNTGNIDAMLESYNVVGLPDESSYLEWNVLYDDGIFFTKYDSLPANSTETLFITVKFKEDVNINDLPTEADTSFNLKFIANYVQADNNATTRESGTYNIRYLLDGGTISNNPTTYTIRSGAVIPNPTKEGYTFTGWTVGKNFANTRYAYSNAGVEVTRNDDGSLNFYGTVTGNYVPFVNNYSINSLLIDGLHYTISKRESTNLVYPQVNCVSKIGEADKYKNPTKNGYYLTFDVDKSNYNYYFKIQSNTVEGWGNTVADYTQYFQLEEGTKVTPYERYILNPTKDIVVYPGMSGNRTYVANWEAI